MANNSVDYQNLEIDREKEPEEYHWTERRADILDTALEKGTFQSINQNELAEKYDVSQGQISQDVQRLKEFIEENQGQEIDVISELGYKSAIKNLIEEGEYYKAVKTIGEMNKWAIKRGIRSDHSKPSTQVNVSQSQKQGQKQEEERTTAVVFEGLDATMYPGPDQDTEKVKEEFIRENIEDFQESIEEE